MKYLFITRLPPFRPLLGGEFDYAAKLIEYLAKDSEVHAIAFANSPARIKTLENVRWTLVDHQEPPRWLSLFSKYPNVTFRNVSETYFRAVLHAARDVDVVFVDFIAMAWCVAKLVCSMGNWPRRPTVIFICHNYESAVRKQMVQKEPSLLRVALALDAFKASNLEQAATNASDGITTITSSDAAAFREVTIKPIMTLTPGYDGAICGKRIIGPSVPPRVTIMANYSSQHKRMVVAHALEGLCIPKRELGYSLDVVGSGESASFVRLYPTVTFLGYVERIDEYLGSVRIGLVPDVIGGGFKMRVLMYAAHRVPIIAVESAMQGMGFEPGIDYFAVHSLAEMRHAIPLLLSDFETLNRLQEAAFLRTTSSYRWPSRIENLRNFVATLKASDVS